MSVEQKIREYLQKAQIMQLATASDNQPWACSVHFVADDSLNLYWISGSNRRHSQEIARNDKVAATIPVKFLDHPVIGMSVEGIAEAISSAEAINIYDSKFGLSAGFKEKLLSDEANEKMYILRPRLFVLFDQVEFPENPRQEWKPAGNT